MELAGRVAVVTGAANGIGAALVRRFVADEPEVVVAVDLDADGAGALAGELGDRVIALTADVAVEADIEHVVEEVEERFGRIDLFFSNAGIGGGGGIEATDETWLHTWNVNLMAHVYAARAVLPGMLERGEGYLASTASAAGLLTQIANAPYSVTKHAAVALAEWIAITYGDRGIKVSCLCPQGVKTNMIMGTEAASDPAVAIVSTRCETSGS
jgi:NAD(P)-dependent dehydrogenase (short-subunit alcohol dehydrogenase family)